MMIPRIKELTNRFKVLLWIVASFLILENGLLAYNNLQNRYPILGLRLNHHSLFYKNRAEIQNIINQEFDPNRPLKLVDGDQNLEIKPLEVGAKVNTILLTNELLAKGKTGNLLERLITQNKALLGLEDERLQGEISQSLLTIKLLDLQDQINKDPTGIMPDFINDFNKTLPAQDGVMVNTDKLTLLVADNIFTPPPKALIIPTLKIPSPSHSESELVTIRRRIPDLIKQPISISSGGLIFTLNSQALLSLLTVVERPDSKDHQKLNLVLRLDDKKLNKKLDEFARQVENVTHAEFDDHDARVAIYAQFFSKDRKIINIPTGNSLKVLGEQIYPMSQKVVYLTFDDGPNSIYHPMILDILKQYNVRATFFLVGANTQRDSAVAIRTISEDHVIGNHSLNHSFLPNLTPFAIGKDVQVTNSILQPINRGQPLVLFRPPYGGVNLVVKQVADRLGLKLTLWDIDPRDWTEPTTNDLVNRIVNNTYPGADILMHSNHLATVRALPKIIEILKNRGYSFETL